MYLVLHFTEISAVVLPGRILSASTSANYSYSQLWFTVLHTDHIVMSIQACADAHILLSDATGMGSNMYEAALGIGGNTKSVMREGPYDHNIVWAETPGILDCNQGR
jgi:Farnesoic acid 0-methyl transferase